MFVLDVRWLRPCPVKFRPRGAAKELRPARARELRLCNEKGAATRNCGGAAQNLTFKIKFPAANICSKFEKFCQIFSAHPTSCDFDGGCVPANWNLKKFQNSFIIYIESERDNKVKIKASPPTVLSTFTQNLKKNNLKSSENLAIIYIESEREK